MVKAGVPLSMSEETVRRVLLKTLKWTHFQRNRILTQNELKLRLSLLEKFVIKVQCATMKYEIIRKPRVLKGVEVNLLKSAHYY